MTNSNEEGFQCLLCDETSSASVGRLRTMSDRQKKAIKDLTQQEAEALESMLAAADDENSKRYQFGELADRYVNSEEP